MTKRLWIVAATLAVVYLKGKVTRGNVVIRSKEGL